jgi:hypothetical protein
MMLLANLVICQLFLILPKHSSLRQLVVFTEGNPLFLKVPGIFILPHLINQRIPLPRRNGKQKKGIQKTENWVWGTGK